MKYIFHDGIPEMYRPLTFRERYITARIRRDDGILLGDVNTRDSHELYQACSKQGRVYQRRKEVKILTKPFVENFIRAYGDDFGTPPPAYDRTAKFTDNWIMPKNQTMYCTFLYGFINNDNISNPSGRASIKLDTIYAFKGKAHKRITFDFVRYFYRHYNVEVVR